MLQYENSFPDLINSNKFTINEADFVNINDCKLVAVLKGQNLIQY